MSFELASSRLLTREWLSSLKKRAIRRRVWYSSLTWTERGIVDLTVRCLDQVRNARLALIIGRIMCKVLKAFRSGFLAGAERVGYDLAVKISDLAQKWGCIAASEWKRDLGFIRYLGVNRVNNSRQYL
ncbi:MAG: hypothetical protein V1850_02650 [Candidatus Bathyarchaeota archaeon]